jgi:ketosteroid isomerase-like protein
MRRRTNFFMFSILTLLFAACAHGLAVAQTEKPGSEQVLAEPADDVVRAIDAARAAFADAYTKQDAKMLSALFHPKAAFAGTLHPYWMEGGETVERLWSFYFATYRNARIIFWTSSFRTLVPGSTVVQYATATMAMPEGTGRTHNIHMRLSIVWVRVPEYSIGARTLQWRMGHMHGSEAPLFR